MSKLIFVNNKVEKHLDELRKEFAKDSVSPASYSTVIRKVLKKAGMWKKPKKQTCLEIIQYLRLR